MGGGIIEDVGTATLMYAVADLPKKRPEQEDELEVLWHGAWVKFRVQGALYGHAAATFTLVSDVKR